MSREDLTDTTTRSTLSRAQKLDYINAVKCLQSTPARYDSAEVPGAVSRFDDFVATHINQTMWIHYTGNFLAWHRYYLHLYEEALREECGYTGTQPYWDWALSAITGLESHPVFDGSETSLSGNGEFIPNKGPIILEGFPGSDLPPVSFPSGSGGGCVTSGPFQNMSVNLGPVSLALPDGVVEVNPEGQFALNPRCLKRDLTDAVNRGYANATSVLNLLLESQNIDDFQMRMQGVPGTGDIGVHGGGHYSMGGDPGRDVFTSSGDPAFYLHHANIDRVWWIWQMLSPQDRVNAIAGTRTFLNSPPSEEATLDDFVDYGAAAGPPRQLRELMSTQSNTPFCYVYL